MSEFTLSPVQRVCVEKAAAYFVTHAKWMPFRDLKPYLDRVVDVHEDIWRPLRDLPAGVGQRYSDNPDGGFALSIAALSQCRSRAARKAARDFLRVLRFAVRRYREAISAHIDPVFTNEDLASIGMTPDQIAQAFLLWGWTGPRGGGWGGSETIWTIHIPDTIREFRGVTSLPGYQAVAGKEQERISAYRMRMAAHSTGLVAAPEDESAFVAAVRRERAECIRLAEECISRIERGEALSAILATARRVAEMSAQPVEAQWLEWEEAGYAPVEGDIAREAYQRYFARQRRVTDPRELAAEMVAGGPPSGMARQMLVTGSMATLEQSPLPGPPDPSPRALTIGEMALRLDSELTNNVRGAIRVAVHKFLSRTVRQGRLEARLGELFGPDAMTVFAAGGELLNDLVHATEALATQGEAGAAALQARNLVIGLGRVLYKGDGKPHPSPITGKTYKPLTDKWRAHEVVDALWEASASEARRAALEKAHNDIELVAQRGAKGKVSAEITWEEAREGVLAAYRVAHAVCFAGGFPPRSDTGQPQAGEGDADASA